LSNLLAARGPDARAVVWAHNSHIGNAAATDMGRERNELNMGQLCREHFGRDAALIGCSTHAGTVAAAHDWDGDMEVMDINPSRHDSYEYLMHRAGISPFLLDLTPGVNEPVRRALNPTRLE